MTAVKENTKKSMLDNVMQQFNKTADLIHLNSNIRNILSITNNEIILHFPVKMDTGEVKIFTGYRVQHNNALGPYKGGLRYHPTVDVEDAKALAMWMTWKTSLAGLPYGGAKGGIQIDPRAYSIGELERITRRFTYALGENIGPEHDIPAPDVNTNEQTMAWMADTFMSTKSSSERSRNQHVVTGKPVGSGGLEGRNRSTGYGVYLTIKLLYKSKGESLVGKKFIVQGFGNVGYWTSHFLTNDGAILVAVQDAHATIFNDAGIAVEDLFVHSKPRKGSIQGFQGADEIDPSSFFGLDCDILIPAALGNQITAENAYLVKADVIAEGANGPIDTEGETILLDKGITIIPDILCNSGGVIGSYFEWLQNRNGELWQLDEVMFKIDKKLTEVFLKVEKVVVDDKTDWRTAAYILAIKRIETAYVQRGIFP
ncbi:MAG: Glu/Leu/Phe/Val dehydrogenase [Flavobacteriaceae bacterium]|jgi:glutamate dehydrogenase (NAD(P)+)|uniref:Glutamate dehydrogenase n=1 Tax=Flavobacterium kayseriense TaxID=2764714 RepID=A0ABR7J9U4_9FLAO|nr:Glu/Leu/Phe/Val dehydrogenase [Flavobacterium kayseriense]MBC5842306.1 Glu/Leu/Phe/Val dehydrogenase [Flavobacterium kayseriense]MBC5848836.1 Glu/Leu/Phe/Val dehydrogenase [Flavobacterium kayseriense]MBX9887256.1 Glu/Leu/Phe/Val dehydrogenase [Flavobacteriaceae bacterium]